MVRSGLLRASCNTCQAVYTDKDFVNWSCSGFKTRDVVCVCLAVHTTGLLWLNQHQDGLRSPTVWPTVTSQLMTSTLWPRLVVSGTPWLPGYKFRLGTWLEFEKSFLRDMHTVSWLADPSCQVMSWCVGVSVCTQWSDKWSTLKSNTSRSTFLNCKCSCTSRGMDLI